jgi:serine/threonine protein kinase
MLILQMLSAIALREMIEAGCKAAGSGDLNVEGGPLLSFLTQRFVDNGQKLHRALADSNERAWRSLEVALAGEGLRGWLDRADDKAFRHQVRAFLDASRFPALSGQGAGYRKQCLRELRYARKDGLFTAPQLHGEETAKKAVALARFREPSQLVAAQWAALDRVAGVIENAGHRTLAHFLRLRPTGEGADDPPLLAVAVRYYFRRAVESDQALFQGLTFSQMEGLAQGQQVGFASLADALAVHDGKLDEALGSILELVEEVREVHVEQARQGVRLEQIHQEVQKLDVRAEQRQLGEQMRQLHQDVLQALEQHRLQQRELQPRDSISIHSDAERKLVKQLVSRYRALAPEQQNQLPALLNALGRLEVATGDYDSAQRDFQQAARLVHGDARAEAEVHYNAHRTALERGDRAQALEELRAAWKLDPGRFAPFPLDKYEPQRILGAGGFGVAFLCKHRFMNAPCVVKTLMRDDIGQDMSQVFAEAQHLRALEHPCIIGIQDCGFADPASATRPYLVMDYFDGPTLEERVKEKGPVSRAELPELAVHIASGLHAAHAKGILHRDVKPANVLVRLAPSPPGPISSKGRGRERGWHVKLIDFGLALPQRVVQNTQRQVDALSRTVVGSSIAGTLDYAAPEQMGKLPGAPVGPAADVFGFGKTCLYALFQTPNISYTQWKEIDGPLADLLGPCVEERPQKRPADFAAVLKKLIALRQPVEAQPAEPTPPKVPLAKRIVQAVAEGVLDALPIAEPLPDRTARRPRDQRDRPQVRRNRTDVTVLVNGHEIGAEVNVWTNQCVVRYDGRQVASGFPVVEGKYVFNAQEDGEFVEYEVTVRGPGMSLKVKPYFTIRRDGVVLFNDR